MRDFPNLQERALALLLNGVLAYALFVSVSGRWLPSSGLESAWIVAALSLWFLTLLSAPWFVPPRDALVNSIGAFLILVTIDLPAATAFRAELNFMRWGGAMFCVVVMASAITALFLQGSEEHSSRAKAAFRVTALLGRGEVLFTLPAVVSINGAYQDSYALIAWLTAYWIVIAVVKPIERVLAIVRQFRADQLKGVRGGVAGTIARVDHPNIIRVKLASTASWPSGRLFTANMPDGTQHYVMSLFSQIQGSDVVGTGLCVAVVAEPSDLASGLVIASHDDARTAEFIENLSGSKDATLVGFVVENSTIGVIAFEVAAVSELREGDVVYVRLNATEIFYQIVGAETFEESFDQNPRGTHVVRAAQLGVYLAENGFQKYPWLPAMNTPLFSAGSRAFPPARIGEREFAIGRVPSTNVEAVARIDELVEYHTAVLGVTGTGKTELALDIVRSAASNGVKIFCVDFTGDYRARLSDLNPIFPTPDQREASAIEGLLATIDAYGFKAGDEKKNLKKLLDGIRDETAAAIDAFLSDDANPLAIFELADISNSKAGLRLTEIYLSAIMNWARANRRARQVLICLEEAHTIVPEAFGSGFDGETKWVVERIGQIALQGRKYGVGLLVITQRTALVSKTILSQCNTFLTHSLIDQTSLNFLESVYSTQHTRLIPNLGLYEFLAFGKAIKAERPIILRRDFDPQKKAASDALRKPLTKRRGDEGPIVKSEID